MGDKVTGEPRILCRVNRWNEDHNPGGEHDQSKEAVRLSIQQELIELGFLSAEESVYYLDVNDREEVNISTRVEDSKLNREYHLTVQSDGSCHGMGFQKPNNGYYSGKDVKMILFPTKRCRGLNPEPKNSILDPGTVKTFRDKILNTCNNS